MNNNNPPFANNGCSKISYMSWPYYWLGLVDTDNMEKAKWVVFLGNDFYNTTGINFGRFIARTNQCLDYVRKNCRGYELIYRPHPDEKNESSLLDLTSFIIQKDGQAAEEFLWANREKIRHSFSFCSTSSIASYNLGINSHIFYHCFADIFGGVNKIFVDNYLSGLPPQFFIDDFDAPLLENKVKLKEDEKLRENFRRILMTNKGPVWFMVVENRYLLTVLSLAKMVKNDFPNRKVNLIISRHHRWTDQNLKDLQSIFDKILSFPRVFYSLKPLRLISAFIISRKIKKIRIEPGSVLVGLAHHDFIENCLMSYNRDKFRLAILPESVWRLNFKTEELGFDPKRFVFNKASFFYNHFLEPLLGLNRTRFVHYESGSNTYFIRLQKPIEEIYDRVYLIKNSPANL